MRSTLVLLTSLVALTFCLALNGVAADGAALYGKCKGCHGADGSKVALGVGKPVKGQSAEALEKAMLGYVDGSYGGEKKSIMTAQAKKLSPEEIKALAEFMAGL